MVTQTHHFRVLRTNSTRFFKQISTINSMIFKTMDNELKVFGKTILTTTEHLKNLETVNATVYNKNGQFNLQGLSINTSQSVGNFTKLNNAFKSYNGNLTKSTQLQNAYIKAVGNQNGALGNYLAGLNGAKASMGGYIKSLIGAKAATIGLQVASTLLNAALSLGLSLALSAIVSGITHLVNKEKEAREQAIENAQTAKEEADNLTELLNKYNQLSEEVKTNTGVKDDLLETQGELLESLGIEQSQLDGLIKKYGDLNTAINKVTLDSLNDAQADLMVAVDAREKELINVGKDYKHWFSPINRNLISTGGEESKQAYDILAKAGVISQGSVGTGGGVFTLVGDDKTVDGILENYQKLKEAQTALNEAVSNGEISKEDTGSNPLYKAINSRLDELKTAVDDYNSAIKDVNENSANQEIISNLIGKDLPQTEEEFETFKQSLIDSAQVSNNFIGSQEDIKNSIIDALAEMPEFEKYFEDLAQAESDVQHETPISSTDILAQVQALSTGLDQLDKIYADVYNKEDFDWSSILNNDGFKEAFGNMTNVTEEYKNAYDDFIKTISNNPSDLSACQSAFNNLATAYIYNSDALKNVTEDTKASAIAMLEQMGIANAEEVVTAQIANNLLEARAATLDFASATDADINSLVAYANQLGLTAADVAQLCLKQIDVSNNPIKTQSSLANLQSLISMAGVTGDKLTYLLKMINAVNNVASLAASGKATQSQITAAGRIVENLQGQMKNISTANVKPQVSYSGGTSTKSAINKANKSSGSSSKDSKETKETFNWVETAISRIQRAVTNLGKTVSATYKSWSTRNSALSSEMSAVTQEISVQQSAYQAYMNKANSVGLSDYYKNLVQNGGMSIEDVTDDTLKEQIQTYKEYYEKALAASDAVQDLRDNLAELAKTKFDNLAKKFENELDLIEHKSSMLDKYIDQTEKKGEIVSEHFYTTLIQNEQTNVDKLQNEYNSLFNQLQDSLSTGGIEVYSDDWYEMVGQINDVEEALVDANSALVDYEKSLLKLRWDNFDYLRDCISDIISETEFLADLLDNKKLFDDSGHLNNYGESLGALYAIEYNTYMNQADEYAKAVDELNKAIAANPNDKDLLDRRQELYDAQREAIKNAESEKNAIKDLISDAYDAQLEALQKLIDKRKELLDATSDLYEYENTISEKTDTIASYQKQLQAYQGDNSEEGIANRQKIQTELEKAQKDLQQTEYEKWKSDQTAMLDDLYSEYETMLNSRLDDIDALVQDVINQSNANSVEIQGTIIDVANQVGYNVSNDLQTILDTNNGMYDMVAFYNENFTGLLTTTNMSINGVTDRINAMISYSDSNTVNIINSINTAANNIVTASLQAASVYSSTIASLQSQLTLATIAASNNSSNHSGGSSGSSRSGGSSSSLKPGKTGGTIKKPNRTMTGNNGSHMNHGWNIATRYAKGGNVSSKTKSPFDDLAQSMGEDTMVAVKEGERILTPVQNEMWEQWTSSLPQLIDLSDNIKIPDFSKTARNASQSNINIGIDNIQMNGVNNPEEFTKQLVQSVQQNGKVQSVLKDLTSNALLGKNSLRINKY